MNFVLAIDAWIIERVAQPVVNVAWAKVGISRKGLCRCAVAIWLPARLIESHHDLFSLGMFALLLWFVVNVIEHSPQSCSGVANALVRTFCIPLYMLDPHGFIDVIGSIAFLSIYYFGACQDPPPRKRKNWKEAMEKFAAQWTWLPARQGA